MKSHTKKELMKQPLTKLKETLTKLKEKRIAKLIGQATKIV